MKHFLVLSALVTLSVSLTGCGYLFGENGLFPATPDAYDRAPELREITIPADLDSDALEANYPIPGIAKSVSVQETFSVPRPAPLTAGAQYDSVRIQRLGEQSWALVAVPPGQLWPQVRGYLTASNMAVASTNANAGLIDTGWIQIEDRTLPSRFRFRVDSGVQRNTAELHVLQQDRAPEDKPWPQASDDVELEARMLRNIAQFIANSGEAASVSMMAEQAMSGQGRISLVEGDDGSRLVLLLPYDRAWASTNKGMADAGFRIDDRNRSEGVFFVTYVGIDDEDDSGFLGWLFRGDEEDPMMDRTFRFLVASDAENAVSIRVVDGEGAELEARDEIALLNLLKGNIN